MKDQGLVKALREHAEWAEGNQWETPITLGDDLAEAADRLENQNAHIAALQQEIEKLRGQNKQLREAAALVAKESAELLERRWTPVEERLPEERVLVNVVWVNRVPEPYYKKIKGVPFSDTACFYRGRWYWDSPVVLDLLAEYGKDEFDLVDDAVEITHWMPLAEPPEADVFAKEHFAEGFPCAKDTADAFKRLQDDLYAQGLITIEGLKRLNELIDECAHGNEGGNDNG